MEDFNAKIGKGEDLNTEVMGRQRIGVQNERSKRLLDFCYANIVFVTDTKFKQSKGIGVALQADPRCSYYNWKYHRDRYVV